MSNFQRAADWLTACGKTPSEETLSLQIGCDLEEIVEYLQCLETNLSDESGKTVGLALGALNSLATGIKRGAVMARINPERLEDALDALCDREVTANGVAFLAGFNKPAADLAVLDANDRKLVDGKPLILEGGKIGKPEGWQPADLSAFVKAPHEFRQ
jgi:predicted HAD superfamily Cof-like phosphohydrolase